jgi:hypothetical protein
MRLPQRLQILQRQESTYPPAKALKKAEFGKKLSSGFPICVQQGRWEAWTDLVNTMRSEVKASSISDSLC